MTTFDLSVYHSRVARRPCQPGERQPNRALCVAPSGDEHEFVSGNHDQYYVQAVQLARRLGHVNANQIPEFASHVEIKAAIWMRMSEVRDAQLVIDGKVCIGPLSCNTVLSGEVPDWTGLLVEPGQRPLVAAYFRHEHADQPVLVRDLNGIDSFLQMLCAEPFENSIAALYLVDRPFNRCRLPDHELRVAVDAQAGTAGLRYMGETGTWYSHSATSARQQVCYFYMGNEAEFPRDSEIPLTTARYAISQFLVSWGERPSCVPWRASAIPQLPNGHGFEARS